MISCLAVLKELSTLPSKQWPRHELSPSLAVHLYWKTRNFAWSSSQWTFLGISGAPISGVQDSGGGEATHVFFFACVVTKEDGLIEVNRRFIDTASSRSSPPATVKCLHEMAEYSGNLCT